MAWTDVTLPAVTAIAFAVQGIDLAGQFMGGVLPPPIEGTGAARSVAYPSQSVIIDWMIIKRTDCEGQSGRVWSSDDGFAMNEPMTTTALPTTTEPRHYKIPTLVPSEVTDDNVTLRIKGWYDCPNAPREYFELGPVFIEVSQYGSKQ